MSERDRERAELGRVDAEAGRVEAEGERAEAEGATNDQLELSRVEAEQGRVKAEERREVAAGDVYRRVTTLWALRFGLIVVLPLLVFSTFLYREDQQGDETAAKLERTISQLQGNIRGLKQEVYDRCIDSRENRDSIRAEIARSLVSLGYHYDEQTGAVHELPAGPIDYYRTREAERRAALARTINALTETFPAITCAPLSEANQQP